MPVLCGLADVIANLFILVADVIASFVCTCGRCYCHHDFVADVIAIIDCVADVIAIDMCVLCPMMLMHFSLPFQSNLLLTSSRNI